MYIMYVHNVYKSGAECTYQHECLIHAEENYLFNGLFTFNFNIFFISLLYLVKIV